MDWFLEELGDFDDDYLIIDCPGINIFYIYVSLHHSLPPLQNIYCMIVSFVY